MPLESPPGYRRTRLVDIASIPHDFVLAKQTEPWEVVSPRPPSPKELYEPRWPFLETPDNLSAPRIISCAQYSSRET